MRARRGPPRASPRADSSHSGRSGRLGEPEKRVGAPPDAAEAHRVSRPVPRGGYREDGYIRGRRDILPLHPPARGREQAARGPRVVCAPRLTNRWMSHAASEKSVG